MVRLLFYSWQTLSIMAGLYITEKNEGFSVKKNFNLRPKITHNEWTADTSSKLFLIQAAFTWPLYMYMQH